MKTSRKKNFSQQTYLFIWATNMLKFHEDLFVHFVKVCFAFKNSNYAHIPPYMHETLPALGNEKEQ